MLNSILKLNKCISCVLSEFCKAYDKSDNDLWNCNDYIRYTKNGIMNSLKRILRGK